MAQRSAPELPHRDTPPGAQRDEEKIQIFLYVFKLFPTVCLSSMSDTRFLPGIIFTIVAVWELFPQYVMPVLTGISVFCLANRNSLVFTNLFGGAAGNEGLGFLVSRIRASTLYYYADCVPQALSFDWQFITTTCFYYPLQALSNAFIGYLGCTILFMGIYYGNLWDAMKFPFLSQELFSSNSSSTAYEVYNQSVSQPTWF